MMHYSYAACGAGNSFNTDENVAETFVTNREKLKHRMAIADIETIVAVPRNDIFVKLQSELDQVDTWEYDQLRDAMLFQAQHLLGAERSAQFERLHIADARGMWFGVFPTLDTAVRMPDPATADMYTDLLQPFAAQTIPLGQSRGVLGVAAGLYDETCSDASMYCRWPTWEGCNDDTCNPSTCCMSDQLYVENHPSPLDPSEPGDMFGLRQYDPRVEAWYYDAVDTFSHTGQRFAWSDARVETSNITSNATRLSITATTVIQADSGSTGVGATSGKTIGSYYVGFDYRTAPATLSVTVDGIATSVAMSTDLSQIEAGVAALTAGLSPVAVVTADLDAQRITIESATTGSGSSIRVGDGDVAVAMGLSQSLNIDGSDATAGTFIGERIPHRAVPQTAPLAAVDPPGFAGFDFSQESEQLVLSVDDTTYTIDLNVDLSDPADAVIVINTALAGAATASMDAEGRYMTIVSSTSGPDSTVAVDASSGAKAWQMLSPAVKSVVAVDLFLDQISSLLAETFADDVVYIIERQTGLLIAVSGTERVTTSTGERKCAVNAATDFIRISALQLENMGWETASSRIDSTHFYDAKVYQRDQTADGWGLDWLLVVVQTVECSQGKSLRQYGTSDVKCLVCPAGKVSTNGLSCHACDQGAVPSEDQSQCDACHAGSYQDDVDGGTCLRCPAGKVSTTGVSSCQACEPGRVPSDDQTQCVACPEGLYHSAETGECTLCQDVLMKPTAGGTGCECPAGYSSSTRPSCHMNDFEVIAAPDSISQCWKCSEVSCIADCNGATLSVKPGFSPVVHNTSTTTVAIFACKDDDACPGGTITADISVENCTVGYKSYLCGACEDAYTLKSGKYCEPCGTTNAVGFVIAMVMILATAVLATKLRAVYNNLAILEEMDEIREIAATAGDMRPVLKQFLATLQILGGLAANLKVVLPITFRTFVNDFVEFFRFDIMGIVAHLQFGCLTTGTYLSSLLGNMVMISLVILLVVGQYYIQKRKDESEDSSDEAWRRSHKKAAAQIFDHNDANDDGAVTLDELVDLMNRVEHWLSEDEVLVLAKQIFTDADVNHDGFLSFDEWYQSVLASEVNKGKFDGREQGTEDTDGEQGAEEDAGLHLDIGQLFSDAQMAERVSDAMTKVFILVFLLYPGMTNKIFDGLICRDLGGDPAVTVLEVDYTVSCADTVTTRWAVGGTLILLWPIGLPTLLLYRMYRVKDKILAGDPATMQHYNFAIGDYKTEYWYWEVVELGRKLILSGLIGLFGRGTIAQCFVAVIVSFLFFATSLRAQPFKVSSNNKYKAFAEAQIFGVLLVCIVLQTNKTGVPLTGVTVDFYGGFQLALTILAGPLILWIVSLRVTELRKHLKQAKGDDDAVIEGYVKSGAQSKGITQANPLIEDDDDDDDDDNEAD